MTSRDTALPDFLAHMNNHGYLIRKRGKSRAGYNLYLVGLSKWRLRFSGYTPMIWVQPEMVVDVDDVDLFESLQDVVRERHWQHRECLILLDVDGTALKEFTAHKFFPRFVIIDSVDQQEILNARAFTGTLLDVVTKQLPLTNLAPYQIGAPVEGSGFFGRQRELNRILSHNETNFAIVGVRRLGKSSLLREVRRLLIEQQGNEEGLVWLDCSTLNSPNQLVMELVRYLRPQEIPRMKHPERYFFYLPDFLKRMSRMYGGPITIFLDEADRFLLWTRSAWDLLEAIRNSVNAGHCRYVIAGFQSLLDELYDNRSPFYQAFEPMRLEPFSRRETADLLLQPMRSMRVRFQNEQEIVNRLHEDTSGHPLLVQFYCIKLIEQLEKEEKRVIVPESLLDIQTSDDFKAHVVHAFRDNVETKDKPLVYALLKVFPEAKKSFTQQEMYGALARNHFDPKPEEIDRSCDRLVLAGVFVRDGNRYRFMLPIFPQEMRKNYNVDHLLTVARREEET